MKHTKQRVIALDYFRGLCILIILLSHSSSFSLPYGYISGLGNLWTSAAELFFLLSGITLGIVRGGRIRNDFRQVLIKSWKRSRDLYLIHICIVTLSLVLGLALLSHSLPNTIAGVDSTGSPLRILAGVFNLSYGIGWATFLMYYAVFMLFVPLAMRALWSRFWWTVPTLSALIYVLNASYPTQVLPVNAYSTFFSWQLYFFTGLTLARFRILLISSYYRLNSPLRHGLHRLTIWSAAITIALSTFMNFNLLPFVDKLTLQGWVPFKAQRAYVHLLGHKPLLDNLFMANRSALLRPVVSLLVVAAAYLIYQKHKEALLRYTGNFVNSMGRDTLWIYVAQAMVMPLLAALPLERNVLNNTLLTGFLILSMWSLTKRRQLADSLRSYASEMKRSYNEAKYTYLSRYEDS